MEPIIQVEGLSKLYRIGAQDAPAYSTLREALVGAVGAPLRRLRGNGGAREETVWALKGVSFEVAPGEVVGVIGRNGAGKSTLLKILSRITEPTEGSVALFGRVASLLEVGTGFHPELTGRENIFLNAAILGMRKQEIDRKFDEIVAFAEIEKFLDTPVKRYSSGMYMRLAFAVAAHMEPEILLVDEVLAVGDAAFQKKCLGKMEDVAKEGRTVLFVSHNMTAMRSLCTRGFLFAGGQLVKSAPVGECIDEYLSSADADETCDVATADLPRPSLGVDEEGSLRITRVRVGSPAGSLPRTGEPLSLSVEFQTDRPLSEVVFGFSVKSSDNVLLFECRSSDSLGPIGELPPGRHRIHAEVERNPLSPGLYSLSAGARCESKGLDYLPGVVTLRVDNAERFESLWLEAPSGLFRVLSDWRLQAGER
ncbi:MAG TPA: ABC transporter ATP-binding protein [Pyrinomonadaceae bacterium]|nr:ABC transporter ATP-binding protein [Pyrinomonadaceae bacterium]